MVARTVMFISSYIPLYILLVVKYFSDIAFDAAHWSGVGLCAALVLVAISIVTGIMLWRIISRAHEETVQESHVPQGVKRFYVYEVHNSATPDLLSYLALFFMPCLGMSIERVSDIIVMLVVTTVVGVVYLKERATYLNPMLLLLGYRSYGSVVQEMRLDSAETEAKLGDKQWVMLMRRDPDFLLSGKIYAGKRFHDFIMLAQDSV